VWGVIGYVFVLLLLLVAGTKAARPKRVWALLVVVASLFSGYSIVLAVISHFYIHSYCIMCIVSYGINFLLLFFSWLVWRRFEVGRLMVSLRKDLTFLRQKTQFSTAVFLPFCAGVMILWLSIPAYWSLKPEAIAADVATGQTDDGHPWIGSEDPPLVITEFADYLCFQCNKMHFYLRQLASRYPGKIKIIHRHFPMDNAVNPIVQKPLHQGSGLLALLAIYAGTEGRFWQMNDYLFANARGAAKIDLRTVADAVGMDYNKLAQSIRGPRIRQQLRADIIDGLKLGITGTPAYLIDGRLYTAQIPPEVLARVLN
jgi:protein-disulfide isomerase